MISTSEKTRRGGTAAPKAAGKLDWRKQLGALYAPSAREVGVVDVPALQFLMIDGSGDPNTSPEFRDAVEALYGVSYALKFMVKKRGGPDYGVMPLEGLWWADDMRDFVRRYEDKSGWRWTLMIAQPDAVTAELFDEARRSVVERKGLAAAARLRLTTFREGPAAQLLHLGPYATEGPTIERLHRAIAERGARLTGKHHEIYLSDPRRSAPEKLRTIVRQPFA
jgi:hypothetical protein